MSKVLVPQAWGQGFDVGARLLPSSGNPYKIGTDRHEAWFDGWCNASEPDAERLENGRPTLRRLLCD